jgi:prephenate dehydrogenase
LKTVAIVGTGLIGGSFGLALKQAGFAGEIIGVSSPAALREAIAAGAVDRGAPLAEAIPAADLVFLSQSVGRILDTLRRLDPLLRPDALVTDAGSTKAEIVDAALEHLTRAQFLGGHPMAGKETRGASSADAGLFRGRAWVLTPLDVADLDTEPALEFCDWLDRIGVRTLVLDAAEHDRVVALTSHLPQLVSTALASTVAAGLPSREHLAVAGPGLVDSTRLAFSSYDLWRDILLTNAGEIDRALQAFIARLEFIRDNLRSRELEREFSDAAALAARIRKA